MTFLEIVRRVAQRTGTVDPRTISSVISAAGRIGSIAVFVQDAWTQIQGMHEQWRFLIADIPDTAMLSGGTRAFTPANLNLTNWASWIPGDAPGTVPLSVWPGDDRARERPLGTVGYRGYRQSYETGVQAAKPTTGQPNLVAVDTRDQLVVWPVPDVDYHLAGTYRRLPQVFAADTEEPIIAAQHHGMLVSAGVLWTHRYDEVPANTIFTAQQTYEMDMGNLMRRYLYGTRVVVGAAPIGRTGQSRGLGLAPFADIDEVNQDNFR